MPEEKTDKKEELESIKKPKDDRDIFIAESIYPEIQPIFSARFKSINEIKDDCLVVLDTNALLVPYLIGKDSLKQIRSTYSKLVDEKRLLIPAQVTREFAKHRANKLTELYQQFNRKISNCSGLQKGRYPLLESVEVYEKTQRLEKQIDKLMNDYKHSVQDVLSYIRNWTWDDPVSLLYSELFKKETLLDIKYDKEIIQKELSRRQLHNIPPGYKDSGKDDKGIGDLLIWFSILAAGKKYKKSMMFISGEEKPDWFHKSEDQSLFPRYELVDEYRRSSIGQSFHIASFSHFLNIFGASDTIVEEVRGEERKLNLEFSTLGEFIQKWAKLEQIVFEKYSKINPEEVSTQQHISLYKMILFLYKQHEISGRIFHMAHNIIVIRNRIVHGRIESSPLTIRNAIQELDELINTLQDL